MYKTFCDIQAGGGVGRGDVRLVIRGADLDGRALDGPTLGLLHFWNEHGRDDIYGPTSEREWDPISSRALVVYRWIGYGPRPFAFL